MLSLEVELNSLIGLSSSELDLGELEYSTSEQPVCSWAGVQAGRDGINYHHICHSKLACNLRLTFLHWYLPIVKAGSLG